MFEPRPQPLQLPAAYGAFLENAVMAFSQGVQRLTLRQEFDLHTFAHLLPRKLEQIPFQFGEPSLGRADQVIDGRIGLSHLAQDLHKFVAPCRTVS